MSHKLVDLEKEDPQKITYKIQKLNFVNIFIQFNNGRRKKKQIIINNL